MLNVNNAAAELSLMENIMSHTLHYIHKCGKNTIKNNNKKNDIYIWPSPAFLFYQCFHEGLREPVPACLSVRGGH